MKKILYTLGFMGIFALTACSEAQESFNFEVKGKALSVEQPTPGSNTAQVEIPFSEVQAAAEAKGLDASKISEAVLEKAEVTAASGQDLKGFESVLLQMTSPKANLTEVAVLNPIPAGAAAATLQIAKNEDMKKYFTGENLTVVLDLNATDGDTLKHDLLLNASFKLSAPKK